jgi:hypothetical protein
MKAISLTLILVGVLTAASCAHTAGTATGSTDAKRAQDFFPLAVGNCWTYETSFQGQAQPELKVCIVKKDKNFFVDNHPTPSRLRFDAEGLRDGAVRYLLKAPLEAGQKWMSVRDVSTVEHFQIEDVHKTARVPAGTFRDCVVVRSEIKMPGKVSFVSRTSYASGVGIVEISTTIHKGDKQIPQSRMALRQFALDQPKAGQE